jgi:hypothetical protein
VARHGYKEHDERKGDTGGPDRRCSRLPVRGTSSRAADTRSGRPGGCPTSVGGRARGNMAAIQRRVPLRVGSGPRRASRGMTSRDAARVRRLPARRDGIACAARPRRRVHPRFVRSATTATACVLQERTAVRAGRPTHRPHATRGGTSLAPLRDSQRHAVAWRKVASMQRMGIAALTLGVGIMTLGACSHMGSPFTRTSSPGAARCQDVAASTQPTFDRTTPPSPRGTGVYTPPAAQAPSTTASGSVASTPPMSGSSNAPSAASPGQGTGSPGASGSGTPAAATGTTPSTC